LDKEADLLAPHRYISGMKVFERSAGRLIRKQTVPLRSPSYSSTFFVVLVVDCAERRSPDIPPKRQNTAPLNTLPVSPANALTDRSGITSATAIIPNRHASREDQREGNNSVDMPEHGESAPVVCNLAETQPNFIRYWQLEFPANGASRWGTMDKRHCVNPTAAIRRSRPLAYDSGADADRG
jgi:hypothetical protein